VWWESRLRPSWFDVYDVPTICARVHSYNTCLAVWVSIEYRYLTSSLFENMKEKSQFCKSKLIWWEEQTYEKVSQAPTDFGLIVIEINTKGIYDHNK
jgi:hypothetical protein